MRSADFTECIVDKEKYFELVQEAAEIVLLELNQMEDTLNEGQEENRLTFGRSRKGVEETAIVY